MKTLAPSISRRTGRILRLRVVCPLLAAGCLLCAVLTGCGSRDAGAPRQPRARTPVPDSISLMLYNVENLFDMVRDGTEYDEFVPGQCGWTETVMEAKLHAVATVIAAANPDIAVLCEVENTRALAALVKALREERRGYAYWAIDTADRRTSVRPAILSRFPLQDVNIIAVPSDNNRESARGMLEADCRIGPAALKLFAAHWPSKSSPESRRIACARALAQRIAGLPPGTDYVIAGDLNANYDECETLRMTALDDTRGVSSINHILKTVTSAPGAAAAYVGEPDIARLGAGWHHDPWLELPAAQRCSYVHQARCETPDHILLPAALFDSVGFSYVDNSFGAYTWDGRLLNDGVPFRWQMKFRGKKRYHLGAGYSDHLPLLATFRLGPYVPGAERAGVDSAVVHVPRARTSTIDGWVPCDKKARCVVERSEQGVACVRVEGAAPKATLRALRRVMTIAPGSSRVELPLRGSGKVGVRMRARDGAWWYYGPPDFRPKRSMRYLSTRSDAWTAAALTLAPLARCMEAEVEIRIGKGEDYQFWIGTPEVK